MSSSDIDLTDAAHAVRPYVGCCVDCPHGCGPDVIDIEDMLQAALPHIRDQLARQIETLPSLSIPGYFATQPSDLIRQDTAARIVRGGEQS